MNKFFRVIISLAVSSLIPTIIIGILGKYFYNIHLLYYVVILFSLYVGLPFYYLAEKLKLATRGTAVFAGLFAGFIAASLTNKNTGFFLILGALTGFVFWLAWDYLNRRNSHAEDDLTAEDASAPPKDEPPSDSGGNG